MKNFKKIAKYFFLFTAVLFIIGFPVSAIVGLWAYSEVVCFYAWNVFYTYLVFFGFGFFVEKLSKLNK